MPCVPHRTFAIVACFLVVLARPPAARAQQTMPPATAASNSYRPPSIVLAQPLDGGTMPQDVPVLACRFSAADASDPLDLGSLRVALDGRDITPLFRTTPNESFASLVAGTAAAPGVVAGPHTVSGRICSLRGACATVTATVHVVGIVPPEPPATAKTPAGPNGLIGVLVKLTRKVIGP